MPVTPALRLDAWWVPAVQHMGAGLGSLLLAIVLAVAVSALDGSPLGFLSVATSALLGAVYLARGRWLLRRAARGLA